MAEKFTLPEIINRAVERGARALYTLAPAKIVKWDASKQRANCQILVQEPDQDEQGNRVVASWPVVTGVPVQFMSTGPGGFTLSCPISDGTLQINGQTVPATTGSLLFAHRSLDKWLTGSGAEVDPEIDHSHALTDAVFMPGLNPFGAPLNSVPTAAGWVGFDGGLGMSNDSNVIVMAQTPGNAQFVSLSNIVDQIVTKVQSTFDGHTHTFTGTVAGSACSGTTAVPSGTIGTQQSTAASKVKAE